MDSATGHALILTVVAIGVWVLVKALVGLITERRYGSLATEKAQPLSSRELEAVLRRLYARRMRYRLGVIVGCGLALGVYFSGGHRLWAAVPLLAACWCQYGVYRHKTTDRLNELMKQRVGGVCPSEAEEHQKR